MTMNENIRIVFSTGPFDYGDDGIEDIVIINGLDKLTFDDIDEIHDSTDKQTITEYFKYENGEAIGLTDEFWEE